jgi:predicted amino acid dehydrogenase
MSFKERRGKGVREGGRVWGKGRKRNIDEGHRQEEGLRSLVGGLLTQHSFLH